MQPLITQEHCSPFYYNLSRDDTEREAEDRSDPGMLDTIGREDGDSDDSHCSTRQLADRQFSIYIGECVLTWSRCSENPSFDLLVCPN